MKLVKLIVNTVKKVKTILNLEDNDQNWRKVLDQVELLLLNQLEELVLIKQHRI